jgi:outer membrane protein OmpA-like peptidoglycan-associated protein/tetratricopeptide (TPR) repeat protein
MRIIPIHRTSWMKIIMALLCCCFSLNVLAQDGDGDDEECGEPTDKKILKLLDQAKDKKIDPVKRNQYLKKTIEIDDQCARCFYELGKKSYRRAKINNTSYKGARKWFEELVAICPDYHTDPYYYIGVTHYAESNYKEALASFKTFLEKTQLDEKAYAKDWQKKYDDVREILSEVTFYAEILDNPVPYEPKIVGGVSTERDEYLPMLSPDNELLFYTRAWDHKDKGAVLSRKVEQLTASNRVGGGNAYDKGSKMPMPFNVPNENYGGVTISVDNREMYITVGKEIQTQKGPYKNMDIYVTNYGELTDEDGNTYMGWSELKNLGPNVNTELGWESQPSLSADGKHLYYAAYREEGTERMDILVSERGADGEWGVGKPLEGVCTGGDEKSPYIHSDSQTLYFASNGHFGMGGFDLFYTKFVDGKWAEPKNIGVPINSEQDEVGLFVSTDGKLAYFSSSKIHGAQGYDVYNFVLHKAARPEKIILIKGDLKDENGDPVTDATVEIRSTTNDEVQTVHLDGIDGHYAAVITIHEDEDVIMTVTKEGGAFTSKLIKVADMDTAISVVATFDDVKVEQLQVNKAFRINDVRFASNKADLTREAKFILKQFASFLKANKGVVVSIDGHTDNVGDSHANLALSQERAFNVKEYLESLNIKGARLKWHGYGDTKPEGDNGTAAGRALNRRTEFMVLSK